MKKAFFLIILCVLTFIVFKGASFLWSERTLSFEGEKLFRLNENGFVFFAWAKAETVGGFLVEQGIEIGGKDIVFPEADTKAVPGMTVEIRRAVPVLVKVDGEELQHHTFQNSVGDVLNEAGISLSRLDKTEPGKKEGIEAEMEIVVTRINVESVVEQEKIPFKTVEKNDAKLRWRKKEVEQEGAEGVREISYEITYKNGKQVSKEKLSSKVVQNPTDEIVRVGTKVEVGKSKVGIASWYAHTGTMACASRMFSRGTWLRVTNQENGKQVFVVVNDYGPQRGTGKMIDLDAVAFKKLAPLGKGVIEVKVEEILE